MTDEFMTMEKALQADGEKLKALTGEDHGPWPDPFEEAAALREFLLHAERNGLMTECLYYIVKYLQAGLDLADAVFHARCEWDL